MKKSLEYFWRWLRNAIGTSCQWFIIIISDKDRQKFKDRPEMLRFIRVHEEQHLSLWPYWFWTWSAQARLGQEQWAQRETIKAMMAEGYSFEKLLEMEISLRLWYKYGTTLKENISLMNP